MLKIASRICRRENVGKRDVEACKHLFNDDLRRFFPVFVRILVTWEKKVQRRAKDVLQL